MLSFNYLFWINKIYQKDFGTQIIFVFFINDFFEQLNLFLFYI